METYVKIVTASEYGEMPTWKMTKFQLELMELIVTHLKDGAKPDSIFNDLAKALRNIADFEILSAVEV